MATHGQTCARPMCIPPSYADLGKAARDIFNKGFGFGLVKLDVKTKSCSGVEFSTSGSSNTDTGKVTGTLETKYKWCEYGLTFTEKWNTDNTLGTEIAIEDQICQGLKLTFDTTFSPNTGGSGETLGWDVDFDFAGIDFAVGYGTGDFQTLLTLCILVSNLNNGTNSTRFGIARWGSFMKLSLDPVGSDAKVNNSSLIGVGYTQTLRP
uniref:Non-selective voltage-gated ion channel VDAC2 n=1 Tax=Aotus nancymaae TaxID=37293 RepID=A0A2K5C348_AOTNA